MERYLYNKFHIDKTWQDKFTKKALEFIQQYKTWYNKLDICINDPVYNDIGMDCILILDTVEVENDSNWNLPKPDRTIRSSLIFSDHNDYELYNKMFFSDNLMRMAIQNMQSDNPVLKEIASAIVKGEGSRFDSNIIFPFSKEVWYKGETE